MFYEVWCLHYGFVTFEDPEVVRKLLNDVNGVYFKDRRLCIRQAFRKHVGSENFHRSVFSVEPELVSCETMYLTTTSGSPYTFHNGVAYFQNPRASPSAHLWTPPPAPVMVSQPRQLVYHQTACHHYQPQSFPNHYQWNSAESPVGAALVMCAQPEYFQLVSEGVSQPLMDDSSAEYFDPALYQTYPVYPLRAERVPRFVPHHEYGKNHVYSTVSVPPPLPPVTISYFRDPSDPENQGPPPSVLQ
ncbi:protein boule-like [Boleophthalmus pectinirostris]|uniref:protein boule-like n=1 Tax=Boleophthalmus pectinirostris TaxID=150288 RepID=UPI0024327869|nr:protein boule-like [Boleophthalmus pectinirostris]